MQIRVSRHKDMRLMKLGVMNRCLEVVPISISELESEGVLQRTYQTVAQVLGCAGMAVLCSTGYVAEKEKLNVNSILDWA